MSRDPMDILLDRERIRGESRMIPEGTPPEAVTDELRAGVIHQVSIFCKQHEISRAAVGKAINYSAATVSEVLKGTYKADDRQIVIELDAWLDQEIRRRKAPRTTQFVWTSVAREIEVVANATVSLGTIGLIYGPETSGIGKTMALRAIHAQTPGSIYVSCETMTANPTGIIRGIATAMGMGNNGRNSTLYAKIKGKLEGTPRLLIIDQVHKLRFAAEDKPLFALADLQDATGAPQLWAGTTDMVDYLRREQHKRDQTLAQIRSRIGIMRDLMQRTRSTDDGGMGEPLFTIEDIRKVFAANKIRITPDGVRFLARLANVPDGGALRSAANLVRIATAIGGEKITQIDAALLKAAMQFSVSTDKAVRLQHEMDESSMVIGSIAAAG